MAGLATPTSRLAPQTQLGQLQETVAVGFMPKGAEDDRWSKFGIPVTGSVGVSRSDFARRPNAAINRVTYVRLVRKVRAL
jgi:hypothetical protein